MVCPPATSETGARRPRSSANYSDSSTKLWSLIYWLKLILTHQESRCTGNHNMVIFRALFGEARLHKKGKQQTCLQCICSVCLRVPSCHPRHREMVHTNDTNLKIVFKPLMQIYTCLSPHSLEMVVEIWNNMKKYVEEKAPFLSILRQTIKIELACKRDVGIDLQGVS
jgi:hypothetical protein